MSKKEKTIVICNIVAAVCFGIAAFGSFHHGDSTLGYAFVAIATSQVCLAYLNSKKYKDGKK